MGVGGQTHIQVALPSGMIRYALCRTLGAPRTVAENLTPTGGPRPYRGAISLPMGNDSPRYVRSLHQQLMPYPVPFHFHFLLMVWARIADLVQRLATGWTVRGSNPRGGEIFRTRPDRSWGPPSLLYSGYRVSFPGVEAWALR